MPKKILVVDDDADMVDLLCINLRAAGFATGSAGDGVEALKKAKALSPDLILLDVVLPELDGYAVCEKLRRDPATASVPIIMLTVLPGEFPRLAGLESGATAYFHKPFDPQQLIARVQQLLGAGVRPSAGELDEPHPHPAQTGGAALKAAAHH